MPVRMLRLCDNRNMGVKIGSGWRAAVEVCFPGATSGLLRQLGRRRTIHAQSASVPTPSAVSGPAKTVQVASRGVIRLAGEDVFKFLQGLVTNDVARLERDPPEAPLAAAAAVRPPLYTAILNAQGRFLYDMFLYRPTLSERGDEMPYLVADVDLSVAKELVLHLTKYRLRAKVKIDDISDELKVWQRFGGGLGTDDPVAAVSASKACVDQSLQGSWRWYRDPRLTELGWRGVFPNSSLPPLVPADQQVSGEQQFLLWRVERGVAEGCAEIRKGEAIPLEYNLAGLNAISFDKGCYVGQELVARTHHRGVVRKRLMPVEFPESQHKAVPGEDVVDIVSKKKVGKVTTVVGRRGLALLRVDQALISSAQLGLESLDRPLTATRPTWWPGSWLGETPMETAANAA